MAKEPCELWYAQASIATCLYGKTDTHTNATSRPRTTRAYSAAPRACLTSQAPLSSVYGRVLEKEIGFKEECLSDLTRSAVEGSRKGARERNRV